MKNWPRHPNGTEKMFSELTATEKQIAPVFRRMIQEAALLAVDWVKTRIRRREPR